jgi:hypothetical protein
MVGESQIFDPRPTTSLTKLRCNIIGLINSLCGFIGSGSWYRLYMCMVAPVWMFNKVNRTILDPRPWSSMCDERVEAVIGRTLLAESRRCYSPISRGVPSALLLDIHKVIANDLTSVCIANERVPTSILPRCDVRLFTNSINGWTVI